MKKNSGTQWGIAMKRVNIQFIAIGLCARLGFVEFV